MNLLAEARHAAGRFLADHYPAGLIRLNLLRRYRRYEPELWLIPELVDRESVAVDVGGNAGVWSLQMARYAGCVQTFEPNPACSAGLEKILPPRARLHRVALSDHRGEAELRFDPGNTGIGTIETRNTLSDNAGIRTVTAVSVPTVPLDDFAFRKVALIKIDVEGHEEAVLAGAKDTLMRERPSVICEIEERHNEGGLARIRSLFASLNYVAMAIEHGRLRPVSDIERDGLTPLARAKA